MLRSFGALLPIDPLVSGENNIPRWAATSATSPANGQLWLGLWQARKTEVCGNIRMAIGGTAAVTPTLCRMGIYVADPNYNLTLAGACANDTTLFNVPSTAYSRPLLAPFQKQAGLIYAIGALVVGAATVPGFIGCFGTEFNVAPPLAGFKAGLADLPAAIAAPLLTLGFLPYGAVTP